MKRLLGVGAICLLSLTGCGDDDPPTLEGPATLTSVSECLERSDLFKDIESQKDPIFDPAEHDLPGEKSRLPSNVMAYYDSGDDGPLLQVSIDFYDTADEAMSMVAISPETDRISGKISTLADTPNLEISYDRKLPDDGIAALKLCTKEDY